LELKGIDVILGMHWLSKHNILINCTKKMEFVIEPVVTAKDVANRAKMHQLNACQGPVVLVVNVFPNVLHAELPGMPPD
jgi:hypothetical protein